MHSKRILHIRHSGSKLSGNPRHPGKFIVDAYLKPAALSGRELAVKLRVTASTLSRVLKGSSAISPEMALRLSKVLGRSAEGWLAMQNAHDLWQTKRRVDLRYVKKFRIANIDRRVSRSAFRRPRD